MVERLEALKRALEEVNALKAELEEDLKKAEVEGLKKEMALEEVNAFKAELEEDLKKAEVEGLKKEIVTITLNRYDFNRLTTLLRGQRGYHDLRDLLLSFGANNYRLNRAINAARGGW